MNFDFTNMTAQQDAEPMPPLAIAAALQAFEEAARICYDCAEIAACEDRKFDGFDCAEAIRDWARSLVTAEETDQEFWK
jgi:hypothetical protein